METTLEDGVLPADEIFDRLAAPFDESEIREREGRGGEMFRFITARIARKRLNDVLGRANWDCKIAAGDKWVKASLTIRLPDGSSVTREALGGYPQMPTEEDTVKGGDSDAFKRVCATFGIAEYLYGDTDPHSYDSRPNPGPARVPARSANGNGHSNGNGRRPNGRGTWGNPQPQQQQQQPQGGRRWPPPGAPRRNGDGSYRDGQEGRGENKPSSGKGLFAWVSDLDRQHPNGRGVFKALDQWGRENGLPRKFSDWPRDAIPSAVEFCEQYVDMEGGDQGAHYGDD